MDPCACTGFNRSELLRRAAAEAGKGLPAIEPGMPVPAGTGLSRRSFMLRSAGLALAVYGGAAMRPEIFEDGIAAAAERPAKPVLVSVFLSGGADSLSVLAPTGHARYRTLRPTLALSPTQGTAFSEDTSLRWHPSAQALATLHAENKVTTFPAIGYTGANQSHFTSRHYWEVGEVNPFGRIGWLGRYLDQHGAADNPLQGLALGWDLAPSLATANVPVATVSRPDQYTFGSPGVWGPIPEPMHQAIGDLGDLPTSDAGLAAARGATAAAGRLRSQLEPFQAGYSTPAGVTYPTGDEFPRRLAGLAAMLAADPPLPLEMVAMDGAGGYDTHSDQSTSLPNNLRMTCDSLLAFQRDLEARSLADRVLVHVWSEFGRRPQENGSGTDHGAGGVSLLIGSQASGRMVGEFPGLTTLDEDDNLRSTSDFRGLYSALLADWMGVDPDPIILNAGSFTRPTILKP